MLEFSSFQWVGVRRKGTKRPGGQAGSSVRLPFRALCPAIVTVIESILDESQSNSSSSLCVCLSLSTVIRSSFLCSPSHNKIPHQTPFVTSDPPPLQMTAIIQNINERGTLFRSGFCTLLCIRHLSLSSLSHSFTCW